MNNLPKSITDYFHYKNSHDVSGMLSLFLDDATVIDRGENKTMYGKDEIEAWINSSLSGLNLSTEIAQAKETDGLWVIETIVSGDFSASPARFIYTIGVEQEKLSSLDIAFAGSLKK